MILSRTTSAEARQRVADAAPDLLEALEGLLVDIHPDLENEPAFKAARAAVAKAEGTTP